MYRVALLLAGALLTSASAAAPATGQPGYLIQTGKILRPDAVRLTGKLTAGVVLLRGDTPLQHYPPAAKQAGIAGHVVVDLLINDMGQVLEAQVISESPPGRDFGLAALDTAKTFEYDNPLKKLVLMSVSVEFKP